MSKSFDDSISTNITIRDGQSLWYNEKKKISNSGQNPLDSASANVNCINIPDAVLHSGVDLCKDLDDDPLHTSLPSDTYYNVTYTHSDNCLVAKFPMLAASLRPIVQYHIRKTYTVTNQTIEDLVLDAVGNMIAVGWKMYGAALALAKRRSGYKAVDEDDLVIGFPLLMNHFQDRGSIAGDTTFYDIKSDINYSKTDQNNIINNLDATWGKISQTNFDNEVNAHLANAFVSNTVKGVCQLLFSNVIKARYADADTNRYYVFDVDELSLVGADYSDVVAQIKQWDENHAQVILNRYTFMPELLHDIGLYRLDPTLVVGDPSAGKDRIIINKSGNTISAIYDESDVIKNILDHNALTDDAINAALAGTTSNGTLKSKAYDSNMFTEADSYLNNELEIGDHILMTDAVLSVLLHTGIRVYNAMFIDIHKLGNQSTPTIMLSRTAPMPVQLSASLISLTASDAGTISAVDALFNTTKLLDPTFTCIYGLAVSGVYVQSGELKSGINTYAAPSDELHDINTYAIYGILLDPKVVVASNTALRNNPNKNNTSK